MDMTEALDQCDDSQQMLIQIFKCIFNLKQHSTDKCHVKNVKKQGAWFDE